MLASAQAEKRAQRSDAEQMVIIVLGIELSTIDEPHRRQLRRDAPRALNSPARTSGTSLLTQSINSPKTKM